MSDVCFNIWRGNHRYKVADYGHLWYMAGPPGTTKTGQLNHLIASAISNSPVLGYDINIGDRCVLKIDGEQPQDLYEADLAKIKKLAGGKTDRLIVPKESFVNLPSSSERRKALADIISKHAKDLGIIVIDRMGNFTIDENDTKDCATLVDNLNLIANSYNILIIGVSHMTIDNFGKPRKLFGMLGTKMNQLFSGGMLTAQNGRYFGTLYHKGRFSSYPDLWVQHDSEGYLQPLPYLPFPIK